MSKKTVEAAKDTSKDIIAENFGRDHDHDRRALDMGKPGGDVDHTLFKILPASVRTYKGTGHEYD